MILSNAIIGSYPGGFSGVCIDCPSEKIDEVTAKFEEMFKLEWNDAIDQLEVHYGVECEDKENPATVKKFEGKVVIELEPLCLNYGSRADNQYGIWAIENTLEGLKEEYPEISYEGLIAYGWSDEYCGDIVNYEISSESISENNNKTYPFVADTLAFLLSDKFIDGFLEDVEEWLVCDIIYEDVEDVVDNWKSVLRDYLVYGFPEAAIKRLLEVAEKENKEIREGLDKMIEAWNNGEEEEQ